MPVVATHAYLETSGSHCVYMFVGSDRNGFSLASPEQYHLLHLFLAENSLVLAAPHTQPLRSVYCNLCKFGGGVGLTGCYLMNVQSGDVQQVRICCETLHTA